jgi:hypothetical protein
MGPGDVVGAVEPERFAEVDPPHLGIGCEIERRSGAEDIAVPENIGPVRDFKVSRTL